MIKGTTVILLNKTQTGTDAFNRPVYAETEESVENVLIAPSTSQEILDTLELTGKRAVYKLAIPKGDTHEWENRRVRFFGQEWRVIGKPLKGMDELIPGPWNMKVEVEAVE